MSLQDATHLGLISLSPVWRLLMVLDELADTSGGLVSREDSREPFVCPDCRRRSWHPQDLANGYCGACHAYTAPPAPPELIAASRAARAATG